MGRAGFAPHRALAVALGLLVLARLLLSLFPVPLASAQQAAVLSWPAIALFAVLAWVGDLLSGRTGFPEAWDPAFGARERLVVPVLLGLGLGILASAWDAYSGWTALVAERMHIPSIHIALPMSLVLYPAGGFITDILFRLFPLPLLVFLISNLLLRGKGQGATFWTLAALLSSVEGLTSRAFQKEHPVLAAEIFVENYALNFSQAAVFRRVGFLPSCLVRISFYLVWHIVWGGWLHRGV